MTVTFYKLNHNGKTVYIGSTKRSLSTRLYEHFSIAPHRPRCKLYQQITADPDGWSIHKIKTEEGIDNDKAARRVIENSLKVRYKPTLNENKGLC